METLDSIPKIIRNIPKDCLESSFIRSLSYVLRDYAIVFACAYFIVVLDSWVWGFFLSLIMGAALGGLFVIGHDAGHGSFCRSKKWNYFFGHLTTSPVLWPFHIWRLDHDHHHRYSSHIDKDSAWRPTTYKLWTRMPKVQRFIYRWVRSGFFFMGSFYTTYQLIKEGLFVARSSKYSDEQKRQIRFSLWLTFLAAGVYLSLSVYVAGWYGFVLLFLIPQIVFNMLLSTFTYFHHTAPDVHFLSRDEWKPELAQLSGSLHVDYPFWLEFFVHDINWHVPHHVCVGVPHYKLRKAHRALKKAYPSYVREYNLSWSHIISVVKNCHFIASRNRKDPDLSWVSFSDAKQAESAQVGIQLPSNS